MGGVVLVGWGGSILPGGGIDIMEHIGNEFVIKECVSFGRIWLKNVARDVFLI